MATKNVESVFPRRVKHWKDLAILAILHLGLLRISPQHRYIVQTHFRRFLPSFLCCYLFCIWNIHFFILVFSDPILFSLSFPVFYFPCLLLELYRQVRALVHGLSCYTKSSIIDYRKDWFTLKRSLQSIWFLW